MKNYLVIGALIATAAAATGQQSQTPGETLGRVLRAQDTIRYSGERVVELVVAGERRVTREYVLRDGPRSRTTYPRDSFRRGFVIVETPDARFEYDPNRNEVRRSRARRSETLHLLGGMLRAAEEGRVRLQSFSAGQIAGQGANGVAMLDPAGNVARRLWIDPEKGLILKAEQFGRTGQKLASFEFLRVNYSPVLREGDFNPIRREGARVVEEEQNFEVPWKVVAPGWTPPNFKETGRGLRRIEGNPVVLIHYTDGSKHFTVFQTRSANTPDLRRHRGRPDRFNIAVGRSGELWFAAVGNLERETLDKIVQSIR